MLTFLRKIRKSLIESSSFRKYMLYAIGEIGLVVIGILIALQINSWHENQTNKKLEKELLINLLSDIQSDVQNLTFQDSMLTLSTESKIRVLDYSKGQELAVDSVFYFLSKTAPSGTFVPTTITYDEMRNANAFKIIGSREIRREIAKLYRQYETVKDNEERYFNFQSNVRNIRIEDFSTGSLNRISIGEIQDPNQILDQIRTNRRFINALTSNFSRNMRNSYRNTLYKAREFEKKLDNYINNN